MTAWTDVIGWTLVHFVWQGALAALATAAALWMLKGASAHVRYVVSCAGLLAALAAPLITLSLLATTAAVQPEHAVFAPHDDSRPAGRGMAVPKPPPAGMVYAAGTSLTIDDATRGSALTAFVTFWTAGVLLLTARLAIGWWRLRRLHADALAEPASPWLVTAQHLATRLQVPRLIHVIDTAHVDTPTVIGWLQPVVLLPVAAMANLSPGQVQAILAHELAHVRRHDFVVNLLQTIAETLLFYHPAVWWLSNRIRVEREHCCDDIAVEVCGDPIGYAEALTTLASWARPRHPGDGKQPDSRLAVAATGGVLLDRVRRLLRLPADPARRRPKAPFVVGATVLLVLAVGLRLMVVAQTIRPLDDQTFDRRLGPLDINRIVGFNLFPGPVHYPGDDPRDARAWDVSVAYPDGEMSFLGFTGRSLIRYAWNLDDVPVVDGPSWLDTGSNELRAETSADKPTDADYRDAVRAALETQYGVRIRRETRDFPVFGLQPLIPGSLGPNLHLTTTDCIEDYRTRPDIQGPSLRGRGQVNIPLCGVDDTIRGPRGYRVTVAELARALKGFNMDPEDLVSDAREVVDQTGLTGVYDFELNLGFLPAAAIASTHYQMARALWPLGIRTFPQALEEQLGLRLVPTEASREVAVIQTAQQALHDSADGFDGPPAARRAGN